MPRLPSEVGGYRLGAKVGSGSFGDVYRGRRGVKEVAIKLEPAGGNVKPRLLGEAEYACKLADCDGIPRVYWSGTVGKYNAMVMELLGPSMWEQFQRYNKRFSITTVLMCADQMIARLQHVHSKGIVHRDIKPHNFLIGRGKNACRIYLVDFGLSKSYLSPKTGLHIPYKDGRTGLTGTARYTSISNHLGVEPTRRDDLEGVGYVLVHMAKGTLPWMGIKAENKKIRNERIKAMKMAITVEELCQDLPWELAEYIRICRTVSFDAEPPYGQLRGLIRGALERLSGRNAVFDWWSEPNSSEEEEEEEEESERSTSSSCLSSASTSSSTRATLSGKERKRRRGRSDGESRKRPKVERR